MEDYKITRTRAASPKQKAMEKAKSLGCGKCVYYDSSCKNHRVINPCKTPEDWCDLHEESYEDQEHK